MGHWGTAQRKGSPTSTSLEVSLGDEAAGLRRLQREQDPKRPHVFTSERGQAFTRFAINKMIEAAGRRAGIERALHPHCLRHTTGSMLANGGTSAWHLQKHLGHANMSNTIGYVRMSPEPLRDVWRGRRSPGTRTSNQAVMSASTSPEMPVISGISAHVLGRLFSFGCGVLLVFHWSEFKTKMWAGLQA